MEVRLGLTEQRISGEGRHVESRDYADDTELLDDLRLLHRSVLAHQGAVVASGELERLLRTVAATGLTLATLDVREHSAKHHEAVGQLLEHVGELGTPYAELDRASRTKVLSEELAQRRPLARAPLPLDEGAAVTAETFRAIRWALDALGPRALPLARYETFAPTLQAGSGARALYSVPRPTATPDPQLGLAQGLRQLVGDEHPGHGHSFERGQADDHGCQCPFLKATGSGAGRR